MQKIKIPCQFNYLVFFLNFYNKFFFLPVSTALGSTIFLINFLVLLLQLNIDPTAFLPDVTACRDG